MSPHASAAFGVDARTGDIVFHVLLLHAAALTFHKQGARATRTGCGLVVPVLGPAYAITLYQAIQFGRPCTRCFPAGVELDEVEWDPGWTGYPVRDGRMVIR